MKILKWCLLVSVFGFLFLILLIGGMNGSERVKASKVGGSCGYTSKVTENEELEEKRIYVENRIVDKQLVNAILGIFMIEKDVDMASIINTINDHYTYVTEQKQELKEIAYVQSYKYGKGYLDWLIQEKKSVSIKHNQEYEKSITATVEQDADRFYMRVLSQINTDCVNGVDGFPVDLPYKITGWFPNYNIDGSGDKHYGIDFGVPIGTNIFAVEDAEVLAVGTSCSYNGGFIGNSCGIEEGYEGAGNFVLYRYEIDDIEYYVFNMHMKEVSVQAGEYIIAGQKIGTSGHSGNSSGAHLHFEVRKDKHAGSDGAYDPCDVVDGMCEAN